MANHGREVAAHAFIDRRFVQFHEPFLRLVVEPDRRGRHRGILEEPGWRLLLWALKIGLGRAFGRPTALGGHAGLHAALRNRDRLAERLGLSPNRLARHLQQGIRHSLWREIRSETTGVTYLELNPAFFWSGTESARRKALKTWGAAPIRPRFLKVSGYFLRLVLETGSKGGGPATSAIRMAPGDWRFLFQLLVREDGELRSRWLRIPFGGSLRETASALKISHTALHQHLAAIEGWSTNLKRSSPLLVTATEDDHPSRRALTGLTFWPNPRWFWVHTLGKGSTFAHSTEGVADAQDQWDRVLKGLLQRHTWLVFLLHGRGPSQR